MKLTKLVAVLLMLLLLSACGGNIKEKCSSDCMASSYSSDENSQTDSSSKIDLSNPISYTAPDLSTLNIYSPTGEYIDENLLNALTSIIKQNSDIAIYYKDISTGFEITYQKDSDFQTASVIKAPYVKYLLSQSVDKTERLKITAYMGGDSYLDQFQLGSEFTVEQLMEYAIRYSDNTAYYTLAGRFGFDDFNQYTAQIGIETRLALQYPKPRFGYLSANDAKIYFEDIYQYIENGSDDAKLLFYWLCNPTENRLLSNAFENRKNSNGFTLDEVDTYYSNRFTGITFLHKYGEQGESAYHDASIVYCEHPYVLTVLTTLTPYTEQSQSVYKELGTAINDIHNSWSIY